MEMVIAPIASFLGGALVSAVIFMLAFVSRLTKVETKLSELCKTVEGIKNNGRQCQLHGELDKRLAVAESRINETERRGDDS